jgi:hypothetical protein
MCSSLIGKGKLVISICSYRKTDDAYVIYSLRGAKYGLYSGWGEPFHQSRPLDPRGEWAKPPRPLKPR